MEKEKKLMVSKQVDYISYTHKRVTPDWILGSNIRYLEYSPNKNYNKAMTGDTGAIVMINTDRDIMGTHVILSGSALANLRGEGHSDIDICEYVSEFKSTRIDICVTACYSDNSIVPLTPHAIANLADNGYLESRLKPDNSVANPDTMIDTCYIGSRKARNRLFRAYDKGLELDLDRFRLIRYEMETRKNSNAIVKAVASGQDIGGIIRNYVDFPTIALWLEIMGSEPQSIAHVEDSRTGEEKLSIDKANRWHWLLTSVAPAMAKALYLDGIEDYENNENLRMFNLRVNQLIEELKNGSK